MMDLRDLRERVAGATGADRIVDFWLAVRFGSVGGLTPERVLAVSHEHDEYHVSWLQGKVRKRFTRYYAGSVKPYTASVDAALALIERVMAPTLLDIEGSWEPRDKAVWPAWSVRWYPAGVDRDGKSWHAVVGSAPTPALALISALLAAVEAGQPVSEAEEWRDVPDCPGYQASSHGRIRSRRGVVRGALDQYGYRWSPVGHWKARRCVKHHTMVAAAFLGPKPDGADVDHLDGDKTNNRPDNLEYVAHADNMRRMMTRLGRTRLTEEQVREILASQGISYSVLAERYNISKQTIEGIKNGRIWKHVRTTGGTTSV